MLGWHTMLLEVSQPSEVADQRSEATADISFRECIWKTFETVHLYFFILFFFQSYKFSQHWVAHFYTPIEMKGFKKKCFLYRGHLKTSVKTSVKITTSYKQKYMYHKSVTKTLICIIFLLQNCKSVSFGIFN